MLKTLMTNRVMEIGDIAQALNIPYKTAARNLKLLERYDFLESYFQNGNVYYRLRDPDGLYFNSVILEMIKRSPQ
jgi:hypothetical protein